MILKKPMAKSNFHQYTSSGVLLNIDRSQINNCGIKEIIVEDKKEIRFNIRDITKEKSFNIDYESFDNIYEVKTSSKLFEANYNFLNFKGYLLEFLDYTVNESKQEAVIRFGYNGKKW